MTDLISWLRHMAKPWRGAPNYYAEAADEIERLTQTLNQLDNKAGIVSGDEINKVKIVLDQPLEEDNAKVEKGLRRQAARFRR